MPEVSALDFARINFLREYALLEQQLRQVLRCALSVDYDAASIIFFSIASTRTRYAIIDRLLEAYDEGRFRKAWSRLEKWLGTTDQFRNSVVHWHERMTPVHTINLENNTSEGWSEHIALHNNARGSEISFRNAVTDERVLTETDRVCCLRYIVNRFYCTLQNDPDTWRDIFLAPIPDQTPEAFLQRLSDAGYPAQPQSWRASAQSD